MKNNKLFILMCLPILLMTSCNKKEDSIVEDVEEYEQSILQERIDSGYFDTNKPSDDFKYSGLSVTLAIDADFKKYRPSDFPDIELQDIKETFYDYPNSNKSRERRHLSFYFIVEIPSGDFIKNIAIKLTRYKFIYDAGYPGGGISGV